MFEMNIKWDKNTHVFVPLRDLFIS